MTQSNNYRLSNGVVWAAIDKFGIVLLQFVINLVLARLLTPNDFGCIGMVMIFIAVSQILIDGGFGSALIQKQNASSVDYSTIFYWNFLFSLCLYTVIFVASGNIAMFLHTPALENILKVLGIVVVINSFGLVQRTKLRKQLEFRKIAIIDITSYTIAAITSIMMAHHGFGSWSLVGMYVINATMSSILFWSLSNWRPYATFSMNSLKTLFSYGGFILIAGVLQEVCAHIQGVIIGRNFSATETGLYTQAKKMEEVACITLPSVMIQVLFPVYSQMQDDTALLKDELRKHTKLLSFVVFPLLTLLIILAKPIILLLFGEKWIESIPYFQALCVGGFFGAMQYFNYYAVAAIGKSKQLFYAGIFKSITLIGLFVICARISMNAVLFAMIVSNFVNYIINAFLAHKYIGYKVYQQHIDVIPMFILSIITGSLALCVDRMIDIHWILVMLMYVVVYMLFSCIVNRKVVGVILDYVRRK